MLHKPLNMLNLPRINGPSLAYFWSAFSKWLNIGARDTRPWISKKHHVQKGCICIMLLPYTKLFFSPSNIKSTPNYYFVVHPCIYKNSEINHEPRNVDKFNNQTKNKDRLGSEWTWFSLPRTSSTTAGVTSWKPKALSQASTKVLLYFSSSVATSLSSSCHLWYFFVEHGWINISWIPCL
jgi:hypothetical protein